MHRVLRAYERVRWLATRRPSSLGCLNYNGRYTHTRLSWGSIYRSIHWAKQTQLGTGFTVSEHHLTDEGRIRCRSEPVAPGVRTVGGFIFIPILSATGERDCYGHSPPHYQRKDSVTRQVGASSSAQSPVRILIHVLVLILSTHP